MALRNSDRNNSPFSTLIHVVKSHETLAGIALSHHTNVSILKSLNRLINTTVYAGQKLKVPRQAETYQKKSFLKCVRERRIWGKYTPRQPSNRTQRSKPPPSELVSRRSVKEIPPVRAAPKGRVRSKTFSGTTSGVLAGVIKEKARYFLEGLSVSGILFVTPELFIFEPNTDDIWVKEGGVLKFQANVQMCDVIYCVLFKELPELIQADPNLAYFQLAACSKPASTTQIASTATPTFFNFGINKEGAEIVLGQVNLWLQKHSNHHNHRHNIVNRAAMLKRFSNELKLQQSRVSREATSPPPPLYKPPVPRLDVSGDDGPELIGVSEILEPELCIKLERYLPKRLHFKSWQLLYSTHQHGISLKTFYRNTANAGPSILLVRDRQQHIFGAFLSDSWKLSTGGYYGLGETFLFTLRPKFRVFPWTRKNEYFMFSNTECLAVGGGGRYGLWVDAEFEHGSSGRSRTFDNDCLASSPDFRCQLLECWGLGK